MHIFDLMRNKNSIIYSLLCSISGTQEMDAQNHPSAGALAGRVRAHPRLDARQFTHCESSERGAQ